MKFLFIFVIVSLFVSIEYNSVIIRMEADSNYQKTKEQLDRIEKLLEQKEKK